MENVPYATAQSFYERSNTANPASGFEDLNRSDFILAVGRVTRRKIHAVSHISLFYLYDEMLTCC